MDRVINGIAVLAGVLFCALVVLVCLDVVARYGRLFAMPWSLEVAEYLLYIITFLGAPWVLRNGWHISVDIVVEQLPERASRRVETAANAIGLTVCIALFYLFVRVTWRSYSENTLIYETLVFPEWILLAVAPPVFALMVLIFARTLWRRRPRDRSEHLVDGL